MTDKQLINQLKIFNSSVKNKSVKANIKRIIKAMEHADTPERAKARTLAKRTSLFIETSKKRGIKSLQYYQSGQYQKDIRKVKAKIRREEKKTGKTIFVKEDIKKLTKQQLQTFNKNFRKKVLYVDPDTGEVLNKKQVDKEVKRLREQKKAEQKAIIQNAINRVNSLPDRYNDFKNKFIEKVEKFATENDLEDLANELQAEAYSGGVPYADWVYDGGKQVVGEAEAGPVEPIEYNQDEFLLDTFY